MNGWLNQVQASQSWCHLTCSQVSRYRHSAADDRVWIGKTHPWEDMMKKPWVLPAVHTTAWLLQWVSLVPQDPPDTISLSDIIEVFVNTNPCSLWPRQLGSWSAFKKHPQIITTDHYPIQCQEHTLWVGHMWHSGFKWWTLHLLTMWSEPNAHSPEP
jgi:hypothetical protein